MFSNVDPTVDTDGYRHGDRAVAFYSSYEWKDRCKTNADHTRIHRLQCYSVHPRAGYSCFFLYEWIHPLLRVRRAKRNGVRAYRMDGAAPAHRHEFIPGQSLEKKDQEAERRDTCLKSLSLLSPGIHECIRNSADTPAVNIKTNERGVRLT